MIEKTKRMMIAGFIILVSLCMCMIFVQSYFMSEKSEETIGEMGELYIDETNRQLLQKFTSITNIWTREAKGIIVRTPDENAVYGKELKEELATGARVRNFVSMELYADSGEKEVIFGQPMNSEELLGVQSGIEEQESWISSGTDPDGKEIILLSVKAAYPMAGGKTSSFMSLGFPVEILEEVLVLDNEESMSYSMIIRKDGKFVVRSEDATEGTYYEHILKNAEGVDGKKPEEFNKRLKETMAAEQEYEAQVKTEKGLRHLHSIPLEGSDWYLISIMSYDALDNTLKRLEETRQSSLMGMVGFILAAMLIVFAMYYRMTRKQLERLESSMREAEKANQAKREFLSNMSHDLRTPMNGIVGMTAIATANIHDEEKVQDCLKKITLSSRHLLGILNDVLDMSKVESGKLALNVEMISLRDTMDSLASIMQEQIKSKNQHFDIIIQNIEAEMVWGDGVRLSQILLNLLSNAVKYTPESGSIIVRLFQEKSTKGEEYVRCHFHVKDNGIGMSEEFQKNIFESFTREDRARKVEGTGLGMAIVGHLVELMDGTVEVESAQGEGSEFRVVLDLKKVTEQREDVARPLRKEPEEISFENKRILLAEDNELNMEIAREILSGVGFEVEWAENGKICTEMFAASPEGYYAAILMDIRMPVMDGYEACRIIRGMERGDADLPIIAMTADAFSEDRQRSLRAGMNEHVPKPIDVDKLYQVLSRYIRNTK